LKWSLTQLLRIWSLTAIVAAIRANATSAVRRRPSGATGPGRLSGSVGCVSLGSRYLASVL
jgi:hypothetical protein